MFSFDKNIATKTSFNFKKYYCYLNMLLFVLVELFLLAEIQGRIVKDCLQIDNHVCTIYINCCTITYLTINHDK